LTVRGIDDALRARLRVRAAEHGRSMEAEVRAILQAALTGATRSTRGLGSRIQRHFVDLEDASVPVTARTDPPRVAEFPE
jgi:plasmid stability protein